MKKLLAVLALLVYCPPASAQQVIPPTFPTGPWTPYTPTAAAATPGATPPTFGTILGRYQKAGRTLQVWIQIPITNAGTGTGTLITSLPFACLEAVPGPGRGNAVSGKQLQIWSSASSTAAQIAQPDGTSTISTGESVIASIVCETVS